MKHMPTIPKRNAQPIVIRGTRIRLIFDGRFVERITTDGAGVGANVPGPHGDGVPFFDFEARRGGGCLFGFRSGGVGGGGGGGFGVIHFNVCGFILGVDHDD